MHYAMMHSPRVVVFLLSQLFGGGDGANVHKVGNFFSVCVRIFLVSSLSYRFLDFFRVWERTLRIAEVHKIKEIFPVSLSPPSLSLSSLPLSLSSPSIPPPTSPSQEIESRVFDDDSSSSSALPSKFAWHCMY